MSSTPKWIVFLLVFTICVSACKQENDTTATSNHLPALDSLFSEFNTPFEERDYLKLARSIASGNKVLQAPEAYVYAAWNFALAQKPDSAAIMMHLAIDNGMANPIVLQKFNMEKTVKRSSYWSSLERRLDSVAELLKDPAHFSLETSSLEAFWPYFEKAVADTANAEKYLEQFILEGPRELRDFYVLRYTSPKYMAKQMIHTSPDYYRYLKNYLSSARIEELKSQTETYMRNLKSIYPEAVFPKAYVVPGILNTGGTDSSFGLFLGGDMFGRSDDMPLENLTDWQRNSIMELSYLPELAVHELMHFQQKYRDTLNKDKVIGKIIQEGSCDFLVELCSGKTPKTENLSFMDEEKNRNLILEDLKKDLYSDDLSKWMYNGDITDRPVDMGYTMGYLICKSYYEQADDKTAAIYELLNTGDFSHILRHSAYADVLE